MVKQCRRPLCGQDGDCPCDNEGRWARFALRLTGVIFWSIVIVTVLFVSLGAR